MQNSRPPLRKLPDIFMQLKEDFKQIILNNIDTLFGLEFYQEQMYFILKLTNGKQKLQIVNFFNVHPTTDRIFIPYFLNDGNTENTGSDVNEE